MSQTRIVCDGCGFFQGYCTCKKLTNEMIFKRLGWVKFSKNHMNRVRTYWRLPNGTTFNVKQSPDPLHDLNDWFKYVWPEMINEERALYLAFLTDRPAYELCQVFMNLPEEKK